MLDLFMPEASSFAGRIDHLVWLVTYIVGFWFILVEGVFFWLLFRYRKQDGVKALYFDDHAEHAFMHKWIEWPHRVILLLDVAIIASAISVWVHVKMETPDVDRTIRVTAQQWAWTFQDPGKDEKLDTPDDIFTIDELHVEAGKTYQFELTAKDVLHSFSVPVFRLKQDAIPGRVVTGWFKPTAAGEYDIQCAEICGIGHGIMPARLFVEYPEKHAAWLNDPKPALASTNPQ
jgi:cytochrome c oxidase subunit 2